MTNRTFTNQYFHITLSLTCFLCSFTPNSVTDEVLHSFAIYASFKTFIFSPFKRFFFYFVLFCLCRTCFYSFFLFFKRFTITWQLAYENTNAPVNILSQFYYKFHIFINSSLRTRAVQFIFFLFQFLVFHFSKHSIVNNCGLNDFHLDLFNSFFFHY